MQYDIIIIGGGHNGLTAATTLAKKNKKVLLLEKRSILGGKAAGEEFHPGYRTTGLLHDTTAVRSKVIKALELEKYGLQFHNQRPSYALLSKDGRVLQLHGNLEQAATTIAQFSQKDAEAYNNYRAFIDKISGFIQGLMNEIPPDLMQLGGKELWALGKKAIGLKKLGKKTMLELLKVAPMSVQDFLDEQFETEFLKAGLAGPAIYGSFTSPRASYSTLNLLLWECLANQHIVGGPQALISTLEAAASAAGVDIRTDAEVDNILLDANRKVTGVGLMNGDEFQAHTVASSSTPANTFLQLLKPNQIEYKLEHAIQHYRSRGTTSKIHLALNQSISFHGESDVLFARTGNNWLDMERAFDASKYKQSSEEPVLDIHVPSLEDPSLAPDGHSVVSILVHYTPYEIEGGWSDTNKQILLDRVLNTLEQYAAGVKDAIVASEVLSPAELESRYSLTQGHIFHGEQAVDQLITRPVPACATYATPIEGLYLCGSGAHAGGGINCMPGYLGAKMMLK